MSKVLIVDDEDFIRDMIGDVLELSGYAYIKAANGGEGIALLKSDREISLVLLDFTLPDISGELFVKRMNQEGIAVPVAVLSGLSDNFSLFEKEPIVKGTLAKPFRIDELITLVKELLPVP